jgi:hypothetical protein
MGHVMGDEAHGRGIEAGQGGSEELGRTLGVGQPEVVPRVVEPLLPRRPRQARVEGVGDGIEVFWAQSGLVEAPAGGEVGQLPRRERHRPLAVLAAAEALLLGRRDDLAVDDQRRRRIVEDRVDTEDSHAVPP